MNNNIIHADNPNSIGGYMFNAGNADGSACIGHDWREIQNNLGYVADGTIEHSAFTCSGWVDYAYGRPIEHSIAGKRI